MSIYLPHRRKSFTAGFLPSDVAGLVLWLETLIGVTTDIDGVAQVDDSSVSANHMVQATGSLKPDIVADNFGAGVDGIQGDGTDDYMQLNSRLDVAGDFSFFMVIEMVNVGVSKSIFSFSSTDEDRMEDTNEVKSRTNNATNTVISQAGIFTALTPTLLEIHRDSSNDFSCFVNLVDETATIPHNASGSWDRQYVHARAPGSKEVNTIWGAILVYSADIIGADRTSIRDYLNGRYNL